jgi:hypothetical protein
MEWTKTFRVRTLVSLSAKVAASQFVTGYLRAHLALENLEIPSCLRREILERVRMNRDERKKFSSYIYQKIVLESYELNVGQDLSPLEVLRCAIALY